MAEKLKNTLEHDAQINPLYGMKTMSLDEIPLVPMDPQLTKLYALGKKIPEVPTDLPEPVLSDNAWYIGKTRYAFRDDEGNPKESAKQMFWRIAYNIATADRLYAPTTTSRGGHELSTPEEIHIQTAREFYLMMATQKYVANTPTMVNAGKPHEQLSACFVLPVEDSLDGILKTAADMAQIHKSGGGTGFSFSRLRPKDDVISTSKGKTTGPISFMQMYNDMTSSIRQGGVRRGANMGILHYNHPDILLFMIYKVDEFSLTNFNISVTVTEAFFDAVKADAKHLPADYEDGFDFGPLIDEVRTAHQTRDIDLKLVLLDAAVKKLKAWADEKDPGRGYDLINPRSGKVMGRLNAKKVYDLITRLAWQYGDPGMIFIDRINESRANPTPNLGMIEATNPCGEQPLLPYDACTLGQINLAKFAKPSTTLTSNDGGWDWDALRKQVHSGVHFLDNVLDMNEYPIDEVRRMTRSIRRIGLGIMGYADALMAMGIGYNTEAGIRSAEEVMRFVQAEADIASAELAKIRGTFPLYPGSIYDKPGQIKPRNGARTTIAPTGTTAMLADCSSGCEPLFALTYAKNTIEGKRMFQTSPAFLKALKERDLYSEELLEKIQNHRGSIQNIEEIPEDLKKVFVVASDITPEWHLKAQAAFQRYVDNAISKTINFNNSATVEDVRKAYWMAYETNCKGITIYRDGSREKQILETKKESSYYDKLAGKTSGMEAPTHRSVPEVVAQSEMVAVSATNGATTLSADQIPVALRPRPHVLTGRSYKMQTPVGSAFITINEDEQGNIFELFINIGHAGSDIMADAEAMGRLISLAFRIPSLYSTDRIAQNVAEYLSGIGGSSASGFGANRVRSLADAVARVIREHETVRQISSEKQNNATAGSMASLSNGLTHGIEGGVLLGTGSPRHDYASAELTANEANSAAQMSLDKVMMGSTSSKLASDFCPDCGSATLRFVEGCQKCESCGYSKC